MKRIAVGMFLTECTHLGGVPLTLENFEQKQVLRGDTFDNASLPPVLEGIFSQLRRRGLTPVPFFKAESLCGGPLTADCWTDLRNGFLAELRAILPIDGALLSLHGSATAENCLDPEGELLAAVRGIVGPDVPIVITLDHHAHVTQAMVEHCNAIVAWETYPHADSENTGRRGADLLADTLEGRLKPTMAFAKVPVLVSGCLGHTEGPGPFADLMRSAKKLEGTGGVVSANMFLVHPYLDVPTMGGGAVVITHDDQAEAERRANELAMAYWSRRDDLEPRIVTPREAIAASSSLPRGAPILLVETADCAGGGASGDSAATFAALLADAPDEPSVTPVVDPESAAICRRAGVGAGVRLRLGHKLTPRWGTPVEVTGVVESLCDGEFVYDGGFWGGTQSSMGPSAVLRVREARVLIMSNPTYDWKDEQFRAAGIDWRAMRFVVVKNPMNYRITLRPFSAGEFLLDTPGPTPATLRHVRHERMQRPYFPLDHDIPGLRPIVYRGHA